CGSSPMELNWKMRLSAPMLVLRRMTTCGPMQVFGPMTTPASTMENGPIETPSPISAPGSTTARGSMSTDLFIALLVGAPRWREFAATPGARLCCWQWRTLELLVGEHKLHGAAQLAVDGGLAGAAPDVAHAPRHARLDDQLVARHHRAPEAGVVDAREQVDG